MEETVATLEDVIAAINYQTEVVIGIIAFMGFLAGAFLVYVLFNRFRG